MVGGVGGNGCCSEMIVAEILVRRRADGASEALGSPGRRWRRRDVS